MGVPVYVKAESLMLKNLLEFTSSLSNNTCNVPHTTYVFADDSKIVVRASMISNNSWIRGESVITFSLFSQMGASLLSEMWIQQHLHSYNCLLYRGLSCALRGHDFELPAFH